MSLEQLLEDGVIDEVLGRLKSGKEADVWLVRHHDEVLCAKVYKDRQFRSFKNNSGYKEGRAVRNSRTQRAMDRGSRFGQAAAEEEWKAAESDALHKLHAQGVRVPAPVLFYEGILLMKLVLDKEGHPAPRLIDAQLGREQAAALYADLRTQAIKMLCCELIHGDLSAYNVLLGAEGPTIIDFPQVVSAAHNSTAEAFFTRDLDNLRNFFGGFDPALLARTGDAQEIWRAYVRRELEPDFVPSGRPPPPPRPPRQQQARAHQPPGAQKHGPPQGPRQPRPHGQKPPQHPRPHGQPQQHARAQGQQPQQPARPQGQPQQHARPQGQPQQHARPQGQPQQHARPQGQPQQHARPQGQPQQHARPQGHHARPPGPQAPARHGPQHPRPQGQQQRAPAPQHPRRQGQREGQPQRQGQPPREGQQQPQRGGPHQPPGPRAPVVERVVRPAPHRPAPHGRPPHK